MRSKSKDTPPQPPPLGQQNPGMDWLPPKGKQTKPRQRKSKKAGTKVDPDLELQQQMLQQQLYQQMEQRHRLMQQKQGLFVEQGKQPGQQPPVSLNQHIVENPGLLAQPSMDMPHPMQPLSHTPELSQGTPSRPDSQISLPPGTPGPQMPPGPQISLPPSTQIAPGYPQTAEQGSFSQRFPTPEDYLKQFSQHQIHQRQPTVQYVAEANNPFSDKFQGLENKGRGRGGAKRKPGPKKPGKPRGKKATDVVRSDVDALQQQQQQQQQKHQMSSAIQEPVSPWHAPTPSPLAHVIKQEQSEGEGVSESPQVQVTSRPTDPHEAVPHENLKESKDNKEQEMSPGKDIQAEQYTEACTFVSFNKESNCSASSSEEPQQDINVTERESTSDTPVPEEHDSVSAEKSKGPCKGTGLEALQKLESMVADMATEEKACKELEKQSELGRLLDENEYDPEMDKIYERDFIEDAPFESSLLSPSKAVGNGSQANSVASLECHEESLISPLFEEPERRKERQKFFAEVCCSDSLSVEKKPTDVPRCEPEGEQRGKEETLLTPSTVTEPTPATCNGTDTAAKADQCKQVAIEDTVTDSTQDSVQELNSHKMVENHSSQRDTSPQLEHAHETIEPEPFEHIQPPKSAIPAPITANVRPAVNEVLNNVYDQGSLAQESGSHQQTAVVALVNTDSKDVYEAFPLPSVHLHETVNQNPNPLICHHTGQVQEPTPKIPARPGQRDKPAKTSKQPSRSKNQHSLSDVAAKKKPSPKEEDPLKKQMQELRRQEYERKKREYEEQQKKKRALQMQLRIEKQLIREQRKRQRIYMNTNNRSKQKTEVEESTSSLKISTPNNTHKEIKPTAPLSLCEPKLLLTHALTHPYGSRPFNGQCLLKGNFGSAKIDGIVDYYSQFSNSDMDIVAGHPPTPPSSLPPSPGVHQHKNDSAGKPLVNGDVSSEQRERAEQLAVNKVRGQDSEHPSKRARYMASVDSARGGISVPPSMPTPPLSDSAATVNDRIAEKLLTGKQLSDTHAETNGKESNSNSSSSSPETVQYIASSSPESDALNRVHTPKFSALVHRDSTDSPTFPTVTVKREKVEHFIENGVSRSCTESRSNVSDTHFVETTCKLETCHGSRVENDSDDLDNIHVTLTLSPTSEQRVTDTVASVADLIGCSPPRRSDIVIEPAGKAVSSTGYLSDSLTTLTGDKLSGSIAPMAHTSSDIYQKSPFSCSQLNLSSSEEKSSRKKPEGPYCRHCDVLIIGIGVKRKPDDEEKTKIVESNKKDIDSADNKIYRVNVEAGDCTGDIFCSEACLKQYFAHVGSECASLTEQCKSGLSALQPRLDTSLTSVGQTSVGVGNVTSVSEVDARGGIVADGLSPTSLRKLRTPSWKEEDRDDEVRIFVFLLTHCGCCLFYSYFFQPPPRPTDWFITTAISLCR